MIIYNQVVDGQGITILWTARQEKGLPEMGITKN
jgi:hypothetical protein